MLTLSLYILSNIFEPVRNTSVKIRTTPSLSCETDYLYPSIIDIVLHCAFALIDVRNPLLPRTRLRDSPRNATMDDLRYTTRNDSRPKSTLAPSHSSGSSGNLNRLSQPALGAEARANLSRRFASESGSVTTMSSIVTQNHRGQDPQSDLVRALAVPAYTLSALGVAQTMSAYICFRD